MVVKRVFLDILTRIEKLVLNFFTVLGHSSCLSSFLSSSLSSFGPSFVAVGLVLKRLVAFVDLDELDGGLACTLESVMVVIEVIFTSHLCHLFFDIS
jgi:hypothetical protein